MRTYRSCVTCGSGFTPSGGPGRPPTRCETCRGRIRADDRAWRTVRAQVLREEPICCVPGCNRLATTVDHRIPLSRGGPRVDRQNLQGMCAHHNFSKGDRLRPGVRASLPDYGDGPRCACGAPLPPGWGRCTACQFFGLNQPDPDKGDFDD